MISYLAAHHTLTQVVLILIGAFLSILGGFIGVIIRVRVERKEEINQIKVSLIDDLTEICNYYDSLEKEFKSSSLVSVQDLNKFRNCTANYQNFMQKIYLVSNSNLRKEIRDFYQKYVITVSEALTLLNSLGIAAGKPHANHNSALSKMDELSKLSLQLKKKLEEYKYKVFWML